MKVSAEGFELLKRFEGCRLEAYLDDGGVPTIGYGTTRYPDGKRVQLGETCTQAEAEYYFGHDLERFEHGVDGLTIDTVTQRQFDALVSFTYNIGEGAYRDSTLRREVNAGAPDAAIRVQFMRWYFDNGKPVKGLWKRRHQEADFYCGVTTPEPPFPGR